MNWQKLPPGRMMDKAIGESLGWRFEQSPLVRNEDCYDVYNPDGRKIPDHDSGGPVPKNLENFECLPRYSTDLNCAFSLVVECDFRINLTNKGRWYCTFSDALQRNRNFDYWAEALEDTPALAICRAYLKWKENIKNKQVVSNDLTLEI